MKKIVLFSALIAHSVSWGQVSAEAIQQALEAKKIMEKQSLFQNVAFGNVGPTVMSGRVVDVDVNPENPTEFYVGYASGGLWYTNNNGMSFLPIMDAAPTQNVGDIAIDWKQGTIWVGTGEVNSSRSSYAGIGILKSEDKGKTWQNMGLHDSHHISRILINPSNPDEVVVGAVGHLYSKNEERGIYKTTNGGKTWSKTLYINDETGIIDVAVSPKNFKVQYAASWSKDRKAWDFIGSGATSGIYKSEDAGFTWKLFTNAESGFPVGEGVGRIGLAVYDDENVYAILDNQFKRPLQSKKSNSLPVAFSMPGDEFLKLPNKSLNSILKNYGLTEKYRAENIKHWVQNGYLQPNEAAKVVLDAINSLAETEVIGAEVYKSSNGGKNWTKTHQDFIDDFFYSYGYYFSVISVDPNDVNKIYLSGVPIIKSNDGGKTFTSISEENVHSDHHVVWVNPNKSGHLINGNDGGLNISYDDGAHWVKSNSHSVSQFYSVNVDEQEPYNIYGGMQDNGVWVGPSDYKYSSEWYQTGKYPYENLMGGDGMQTQIDKRNPNIVFTGFQFGNYYRIDRATNKREYISPKPKKDEKPFRFNWQTPILLSSHNQDILYMGSNFLHRSMNQGETWTAISPDLTQGAKEGNVAFGTIAVISESTLQFGLLYTGSDDGLIHVSKDGGATWNKISGNLPQNKWVSRVVASAHKKERVYATLNGYRNDDFTSYVYMSDDFGQTWKNIANNLPASPVNVIVEDNVNENVIYVGTDNGLYVSLNKGTSWDDFSNGIPNVAVHDLVIQKKAKDLVVGTHGRSIYKVNLDQVQQLNDKVVAENLHVFELKKIKKTKEWGNSWSSWAKASEPKAEIWFYSNGDAEVLLQIENSLKEVVYSQKVKAVKGLNKHVYDLSITKAIADNWKNKDKKLKLEPAKNGNYYLPVSVNKISIQKGKEKVVTDLEIIESK
ncbi:glycosyl hydrolase [Flavobacterium sp. GSP27]|uniref:sialidase family protein n=1 Tax=Flavobacterium sp. GSP27 TaxID=2497489 RepID=UPI000F829953|nr:sialidase family protein [Flavobacterium sp. GSP27]RTY96183.1 glycosyl hydrolase [Flavobacterium sp. GSN2]RTZ11316.1 glycosyl hydrolase [Flavobacterium sp. GSP27]